MQQYWESPGKTLVVPAGTSRTLTLRHPTRQRLVKIAVVQTVGDPVLFNVNLFNREVEDEPADGGADELWRITDQVPADAAGVLHHRFPDVDVYFQNRDDRVYVQKDNQDTPSLVSIMATQKLYVRLTNTGANEGTFLVTIGSESQS